MTHAHSQHRVTSTTRSGATHRGILHPSTPVDLSGKPLFMQVPSSFIKNEIAGHVGSGSSFRYRATDYVFYLDGATYNPGHPSAVFYGGLSGVVREVPNFHIWKSGDSIADPTHNTTPAEDVIAGRNGVAAPLSPVPAYVSWNSEKGTGSTTPTDEWGTQSIFYTTVSTDAAPGGLTTGGFIWAWMTDIAGLTQSNINAIAPHVTVAGIQGQRYQAKRNNFAATVGPLMKALRAANPSIAVIVQVSLGSTSDLSIQAYNALGYLSQNYGAPDIIGVLNSNTSAGPAYLQNFVSLVRPNGT